MPLAWKMSEKSSWNPDVFLNSICLQNTGDQGNRELGSSTVLKVELWTWLQTLRQQRINPAAGAHLGLTPALSRTKGSCRVSEGTESFNQMLLNMRYSKHQTQSHRTSECCCSGRGLFPMFQCLIPFVC